MKEETALAPIMPVNSMADLAVIGKTFASSGMFGCTNEAQGTVLALTCMTERISPLKFNQTYHIIEGKPTMRADAMLAKFAERGGKFTVIEKSPARAAIRLQKDSNDLTLEMTLEQAMAEPFPWTHDKSGKRILKKNWSTPWMQKCMIWSRVVSDGVRTVDPGVNMGVYTPEEIQDLDDLNDKREARDKKKPEESQPMKTVKGEVLEEKAEPKSHITGKPLMMPGRGTLAQEEAKGNLTPPEIDYGVFPAGKLKGTRFEDSDEKTLEFVLTPACAAKYPEFQQGHFDAVKAILIERAADKDAKNEPFPEEN